MSLKDYPLPARTECSACGQGLDACTETTRGERPGPGALSICFYCGHITTFDVQGLLRELTDEERADAMRQRHVRRAVAMAKFARGRNETR